MRESLILPTHFNEEKRPNTSKPERHGKIYAFGVYMLPLELYERQRLIKRVRQTFSRMLCKWSSIFLPDVKFSQNHQPVYIQTAREKLTILKDHLSEAL